MSENEIRAMLEEMSQEALEEPVTENVPDWDPRGEDAPHVEGVVEAVINRATKYGDKIILLLKKSNGEKVQAWISGAALERQYRDLEPPPVKGDLVAIGYLGERQSKAGNTYHAYNLKHRPMSSTPVPEPETLPFGEPSKEDVDRYEKALKAAKAVDPKRDWEKDATQHLIDQGIEHENLVAESVQAASAYLEKELLG